MVRTIRIKLSHSNPVKTMDRRRALVSALLVSGMGACSGTSPPIDGTPLPALPPAEGAGGGQQVPGGCTRNSDCPADGVCSAGRCVITLVRNESGPQQIAVDDTSVYWSNQGYMTLPAESKSHQAAVSIPSPATTRVNP